MSLFQQQGHNHAAGCLGRGLRDPADGFAGFREIKKSATFL
jgi:hypothetical protein